MINKKVSRVIWFPTGSRTKSSSRIQVFNIHDKLLSLGYESIIGYNPKRTIWHLPFNSKDIERLNLQEDDLIIIQKFKKKSTKRVIELLKQTPVQIGYIDCDAPIVSKEIAQLVDFVIVPSVYLKERYEELGVKCYSIPDCPEKFSSPVSRLEEKENLKCVWFGNHSKSKWKEVEFFETILKQRANFKWEFETISNTNKSTKRWNKNSFNDLSKYDLVVIPVPEQTLSYKVKSANRLLQSMALGIPVIASPIPSYEEIIKKEQLENILCQTTDDWLQMLEFYESSQNRLRALTNNYKTAQKHALDNIINQWIEAFRLTKNKNKKEFNYAALDQIKKKAWWMGYEIKLN